MPEPHGRPCILLPVQHRRGPCDLGLDHDGYLPCFGIITDGKVADVKDAHQMRFAPGTIVVDDRGYNDYRLFAKWTDAGVYFVTRIKDNALFEVVEECAVPQNRNILEDQTIRLTGTGAQDKCSHLQRRAEAVREDTGGSRSSRTSVLSR